MALKFVQTQAVALYSGLSAAGNSMVISPYPRDIQTNVKLTFADFGTTPTCTIDPKIPGYEEIVSFTGITDNGDDTATFTGLTRNLIGQDPYTTPGTGKQHGASAVVVFSDNPQMFARLMTKENDETVTGKKTFPSGGNANAPVSGAVYSAPTDDLEYTSKKYVDDIAIAGAPKATETVYGLSKLSVAAVDPLIPIVVGDNDTRVPTQDENNALVGNNTDIAVGTGNKMVTQTGLQKSAETYAASTTGNDTYVVTLSPVPTSLVNGMKIRVKFDVANTGASTLNVNGLGALAIVTGVSTATATGDIVANLIGDLIYNSTGTVWQLVNPASTILGLTFTNGTTTKNATDASGTQNIAHGLPKIPRKVIITAQGNAAGASSGDVNSFTARTVYNGTTQSSVSTYGQTSTPFATTAATFSLNTAVATGDQTGVVTFDATNIIITWTKTGSPTGTYTLLWEAETF